jgi:hypothetical protein
MSGPEERQLETGLRTGSAARMQINSAVELRGGVVFYGGPISGVLGTSFMVASRGMLVRLPALKLCCQETQFVSAKPKQQANALEFGFEP